MNAEPPAGRLVVVRHGSTAWSSAGRHTGRTDVELDERGRAQAAALGERLAGHHFASVLVSPLVRARHTCELAGFASHAEVYDGLAEWDYGDYEGLTTEEIRKERPGWQIWRDGVPGGETLDQLAARADAAVALARRSGGDVLAFAHGHVLRVVAARWVGMAAWFGQSLLLAPAGVGVLGWERETPAIGRWDDDGSALLGAG